MLFGREEELKNIEKCYSLTEKGGYALLINGESGIGKTALVEHFLSKKDCVKLKGSCSPILTPPLHPFREALKSVNLDNLLTRGDIPRVIMLYVIHNNGVLLAEAERVEIGIDTDIFTSMLSAVSMFVKDSFQRISSSDEYLEELRYGNYNLVMKRGNIITIVAVLEGRSNEFLHNDLKNILDEIEEDYFGILKNWDGNMESMEGIKKILYSFIKSGKYDGGIVGGNVQEWNFENIRLGLKRISKDKVVCVFIDDIQWADETTLSLMHYLARSREGKMLIIGTYRSEEKNEKLREFEDAIIREGIGDIISVNPLDRDSTLFLTEKIVGGNVGVDVLNYIYERSEGIPLHIIELTRLLMEEYLIEKRDEIYHLKSESSLLPAKIEYLVERRFRNMGDDERDIMEFSSVIGNYISPALISCAFQKKKIEVLRILRKLLKSGFVIKEGKNYKFYHDYVRDAIYRRIEEDMRKEMHEIAAECIEKSDIEEDLKNSMMAEHYFNAGICEKAIYYGKSAVKNALENYAYREAIKFGKMILECYGRINKREGLMDSYAEIGRLYYLIGDYENAIKNYEECLKLGNDYRAFMGIGDAYFQMGIYEEAERYYEEAIKLKNDLKEKISASLGNVYMRMGKFEEAEKCFKGYIEWSKKRGDNEDLIKSNKLIGGLFWRKGDYDRAIEYFQKSLETARKTENKKEMADIFHNIGTSLYAIGRVEDALSYILKSLDIRESIGDIGEYPKSANLLGLIYWNLGNDKEARKYFELSLKYSILLGKKGDEANALSNIGILDYYERKYEEGEKNLLKSIEIFEELKKESWLLEPLLYLISLYLDMKKYKEVEKYISRACDITKRVKIENYLTWLEILRCRYDYEKDGKEYWEDLEKKIDDNLLLAIFYQHRWRAKNDEEDMRKSISLFKKSGFLGDLAYFKN